MTSVIRDPFVIKAIFNDQYSIVPVTHSFHFWFERGKATAAMFSIQAEFTFKGVATLPYMSEHRNSQYFRGVESHETMSESALKWFSLGFTTFFCGRRYEDFSCKYRYLEEIQRSPNLERWYDSYRDLPVGSFPSYDRLKKSDDGRLFGYQHLRESGLASLKQTSLDFELGKYFEHWAGGQVKDLNIENDWSGGVSPAMNKVDSITKVVLINPVQRIRKFEL